MKNLFTGLTGALAVAAVSMQTFADPAARTSYAALSAYADEEDGRQNLIEIGLSLGEHARIGGGFGKSEARVTDGILKSDLLSASFGLDFESVEFSLSFINRDANGSFEQHDWMGALGWRGERGGIGIDGFHRNSESETVDSIATRRGNPRALRVIESLSGSGFGLHGDFDLTSALNLFGSAMNYRYGNPVSNHPALSRLLFLGGSGLTRGEAFLESSYGAGMTYRFEKFSLTGQYFHDEAIENADAADTLELQGLFLLGSHWSFSPSLGHSDSDLQGGIGYAGLTLSYNW